MCLNYLSAIHGKIEKIMIGKVDDPEQPQYGDTTKEDLERALKGKFVSCNVQYRDSKTDILVCNVFVQRPPEGFWNKKIPNIWWDHI